ncbi:MAG: DUF6788 family protein [bacterium]
MTREESNVQRIKYRLHRLGPFLPGSISRQFNICGNPGCRCKNPRNPKRHGPYYQLSYTANGRSSTRFVKKTELAEARRRLDRFRRFKRLNAQLLDAYLELARKQGLSTES